VARRVFLEDVRRAADGSVVQPVRYVVLGRGVGVVCAERGDGAVERVCGGRMVRRFAVHDVPAIVHQDDGVHEPRVPGGRRVQDAELRVRVQAAGGRVRAQLAAVRTAPTPVPYVRVRRGHGVSGAHVPHEPDAAVRVVHAREASRRPRVAVVLLQRVHAELEHVLYGDALRANVLHGVPEVLGHQRRAVGRPGGRDGQQQVSDGA